LVQLIEYPLRVYVNEELVILIANSWRTSLLE